MVVELADFGGNFPYLPTFQTIAGIENGPVLLLELPQLGVDVEGAAKVSLPLLVSVLGQVTEAVEKLLRLFQQMTKLTHHLR